jgi:hypothetical protein
MLESDKIVDRCIPHVPNVNLPSFGPASYPEFGLICQSHEEILSLMKILDRNRPESNDLYCQLEYLLTDSRTSHDSTSAVQSEIMKLENEDGGEEGKLFSWDNIPLINRLRAKIYIPEIGSQLTDWLKNPKKPKLNEQTENVVLSHQHAEIGDES